MLDSMYGRGPGYIAQQNSILGALSWEWGLRVIHTPKDSAARIDAFMVNDAGVACRALEVKTREFTRADAKRWGTYLISQRKLEDGRFVSELLQIPFLVAVGLPKENLILVWHVTKHDGTWNRGAPETRVTETQETCNGGTISRENAFLPFADATAWPWRA
jgi:hypothetical protein